MPTRTFDIVDISASEITLAKQYGGTWKFKYRENEISAGMREDMQKRQNAGWETLARVTFKSEGKLLKFAGVEW